MTERTQDHLSTSQNSNFRVAQALYKTILTNIKVILVLFLVGLAGWLFWYLSPLTEANSTYNATAHETALRLVVNNLVDVKKGGDMAINSTPNTSTASCDFLSDTSQKKYQENLNTINTSLANLYKQKTLANQYQLDSNALWQSACQQNITADDMTYALKTLASESRLNQLNWAERRPSAQARQQAIGVATLPENWLTQTNPWYGLPGCVYVKTPVSKDNPSGYSYVDGGNGREMAQLCNHPDLVPNEIKAKITSVKTPASSPSGTIQAIAQGKNSVNSAVASLKQQTLGTTAPLPVIKSTRDNNASLPANLGMMYSELSNIHSSHFDKQLLDAYQTYQQKNDQRNFWQKLTEPPVNSIELDGSRVKIGYNMALTLDPTVQNQAQLIANCVTKNPADSDQAKTCDGLMAGNLQGVANQMYENSLVRSIGIAVIDVKTQGVLAMASSESPCYAKDNGTQDERADATGCPILWKKDWSGQNLLNHALYQTVYPGSTVKTIQALALVRANPAFKNQGSPEYNALKQVMASSSTERVANYLFCYQTTSNMILNRNAQGVCAGIPEYKKASNDMGWSANCDKASTLCGFKDLLFGLPYNSDPMLQSRYFSGVLLTDSKQHLTNLNFSNAQIASCVEGNDGRMSGSCAKGGDDLNEVMNEVFGAGNAKTSVLGVADSFSSLLIADNGQKQRRGAHIVEDLWGVNQIKLRPKAWRGEAGYGKNDNLATFPLNISQSDANASLSLLSGTLLTGTGLGGGNGTAYTACTQAIGDCGWTKGVIVGKTGTPGFNFPTVENGNRFYTPNVTTQLVETNCFNPEKPSFLCQNRPYKWFVYGIKGKDGKWDKAVAVLVERNWTKSGMVDDPHDGINRAVQAGMLLAKQLYK